MRSPRPQRSRDVVWRLPAPIRSLALVALLISACSSPGSSQSSASYIVDTAPPGARLTALLEGVLRGQAYANGSACFWIDDAGGRTELVWPQGYSGAENPLQIHNEKGQTLAQVGQRISVSGGLGPNHPGASCPG